jgi:hypothetical protein
MQVPLLLSQSVVTMLVVCVVRHQAAALLSLRLSSHGWAALSRTCQI